MTTPCKDCPLRRTEAIDDMTEEEVRFMQRFKKGELRVQRGTTILMEGANAPQLFTVLRGMGVRSKSVEGGRRQVLNFVFPGDFLGLQAGVMGEMNHSAEATTDMVLCVFQREEIWQLFRQQPRRAFDLTWLAASEERFLGEALATVGQRPAENRIAWALMRIYQRLQLLGLEQGDRTVPLPYRQQDLADALGLSLVHTNKTLARLRERQIASWSDKTLRVPDLPALAGLADVPLEPPQKRPLI